MNGASLNHEQNELRKITKTSFDHEQRRVLNKKTKQNAFG